MAALTIKDCDQLIKEDAELVLVDAFGYGGLAVIVSRDRTHFEFLDPTKSRPQRTQRVERAAVLEWHRL